MTAQDLKNAIIQLAVQGKLIPQDPNDEPASELLKRIKAEKERLIKEGKVTIDKKHTASPISEDDIPYDLPETWHWVKFADIVTFYSGKTPERHTASYWSKGEYTWVSITDMVSDGITVETKERITHEALSDCFSDRVSPAGTMIMSFKLTIGKVSILGVDAVHNEAIISIFPFLEDSVLKDYLFKILPLVANSGDSKNAIKGKTLNATSLSNLMIPLPPLTEQKRIIAKIEELMPLVEEYGKAEERLTELNAAFPDKLRKSILQQAIQGKLTERDPADEPASELLKRIRGEKERLVKEGKIKKEKPLPPIMEEEMPFEIPDTWAWVRFSSIINYMSTGPFGSMLHKSDYVSNGIPLVNPANIVDEHIIPSERMMVSKETTERLSSYKLQKGMIVMGRRGEMGRCAVITDAEDGWLCGTGSFFMEPSSLICCDYLIKFFASVYAKNYLGGESVGSTMNNLNHTILNKMPVPLPPLAEQQRIVNRVNELFAMCDELE